MQLGLEDWIVILTDDSDELDGWLDFSVVVLLITADEYLPNSLVDFFGNLELRFFESGLGFYYLKDEFFERGGVLFVGSA